MSWVGYDRVRYPVVLFDLDGTVIDSGGIILASMRHASREVLGRVIADAELMQAVGGPGLEAQMAALDRAGGRARERLPGPQRAAPRGARLLRRDGGGAGAAARGRAPARGRAASRSRPRAGARPRAPPLQRPLHPGAADKLLVERLVVGPVDAHRLRPPARGRARPSGPQARAADRLHELRVCDDPRAPPREGRPWRRG